MKLFLSNHWQKPAIHLGAMLAVSILLICVFFFIYLPMKTNHGETITVPDLEGMPLADLDEFLTERTLRYEINSDSGFSSQYPPLAVLKQFPLAHSKVKENRKIYISLNAKEPPKVRMPQLIDGSVKNAQVVLKSYDLLLGEIEYAPDLAQNAVLNQLYKGRPVKEGEYVPKGATIDLIVGDGLGNQVFGAPSLIGLTYEDAEFSVIGQGLRVGNVRYGEEDGADSQAPGTVFKQSPDPESDVKVGDYIDIWVAGPKPK